MDCKFHENHSATDGGNAKRGKTVRIVDVAFKTLLALNTSMKEIKCWENERSVFKTKISDQNAKIRFLETNNDDLTREIKSLKSWLAEAKNQSREQKVDDLTLDDGNIDALLVHSAGKIIRTIRNLSNELVNNRETMNVVRNHNERLRNKTDRLRAMVRASRGNSKDFRNRIAELNGLVVRINKEIPMLKNSLESVKVNENRGTYDKVKKKVVMLMKELDVKLKNDRRALFAGGNPYWNVYLRRISKLEDSSEGLLLLLKSTKAELVAHSCGIEYASSAGYRKSIDELEQLVKRVGSDVKRLKTGAIKIGCRAGGESPMQYSKKMTTLEKLVATSKSIIDKLIIESKEDCTTTPATLGDQLFSGRKKNIEALETLAKKFKTGIRELEIAVASMDSSKLLEKNRLLENSVGKLRNEIVARNEENNSLGLELAGAKIAFEEKVGELKKLQNRYEKMANKMKNRGRGMGNDYEQQVENLARELEGARIEARDAKTLRDEMKKQMLDAEANFEVERTNLQEEIVRNRSIIDDKDSAIVKMSKDKESVERKLTKVTKEMKNKLTNAAEEMERLKKANAILREDIESTSIRCQTIVTEAVEVESNRLKSLLRDATDNLESARNECATLTSRCTQIINDKTKIESELSRVKIQNEALIDRLNSEKATNFETLRDHQKLVTEFRVQESDLQILRTERSVLKTNLEESERDKEAMRAEVAEVRRINGELKNESLSLKSKVNELSEELKEANRRSAEIDIRLNKLVEESGKQKVHLDSLIAENDKLNEHLDKTRSDKLNIAGTLNEWKLRYEETKDLLESKLEEANSLREKLDHSHRDIEELKVREVETQREVTKLTAANDDLRRTIAASNSYKAKLEEQLECLNNESRVIRSRVTALQSDNDVLRTDSSDQRQRADKLTEDVKKLTSELEQRRSERLAVDVEHREATERHQRKLQDFKIEHDTLKIELARLRTENGTLKLESNKISVENERMRRNGGTKSEISRLTMENEGLKFELVNLRDVNSNAGKEIELGRMEMEKLREELRALNTEKCTLNVILEKMKMAREAALEDCRNAEERSNLLNVENERMRKYLEVVENDIASRDDKTNKLKADKSILQATIEELERSRLISSAETEEIRSRHENLVKEMSDVMKEDIALRNEVNTLRSVIEKMNNDNSNIETDFARVEDELEALKAELARLRAGNGLLKSQFDGKTRESCRLESENAALKEKLEELRRSKFLEAEEAEQLRKEYENLKLHKVTLESKLMDAQKEIDKYTVATSKLNVLEEKLKGVLKDYVVTKKLLRSANEEVDQLRLTTFPYKTAASTYNENIEAN